MTKVLALELRATELKLPGKKGGFFGRKIDSFYVMKGTSSKSAVVTSSVVRNCAHPSWPVVKVDFRALCNQNVRSELKIQVWHYDKNGDHQLLGTCRTHPVELLDMAAVAESASVPRKTLLRRGDKNKSSSPYFSLQLDSQDQPNGKVFVVSASLTSGQPTEVGNPWAMLGAVPPPKRSAIGPVDLDDSNTNIRGNSSSDYADSDDSDESSVLAPKEEAHQAAEDARRIVQQERLAKIRAAQRALAAPSSRETVSEVSQQELLQRQRQQQVQERLAAARAERLAQREREEKAMAMAGETLAQEPLATPEAAPSKMNAETQPVIDTEPEPKEQVTDEPLPLTEAQLRQKKAEDRARRVMEAKKRREERLAAERAQQAEMVADEKISDEVEAQRLASAEVDTESNAPVEASEPAAETAVANAANETCEEVVPGTGDEIVPALEEAFVAKKDDGPAVVISAIPNEPVMPGEAGASKPEKDEEGVTSTLLDEAVLKSEENAAIENEAIVPQKAETSERADAENTEPHVTAKVAIETAGVRHDVPVYEAVSTVEEAKPAVVAADTEWEQLSELSEDVVVLEGTQQPTGLLGPSVDNTEDKNDNDDDLNLLDNLLSDAPSPGPKLTFRHQSQQVPPSRTTNKPVPSRARSYSPLQKAPKADFPYITTMFDSNSRTAQSQLAFVERMKSARKEKSSSSASLAGLLDTDGDDRSSKNKLFGGNVYERLYRNDIATYAAKRINKEYYQ